LASTAVRNTGGRAGPGSGTPGPTRHAAPRGLGWRDRLRADRSTTPGRLRLVQGVLVLLSLVWGALAAFTVVHYASAASSVVAVREPLSLDAQQIYRHLSAQGGASLGAASADLATLATQLPVYAGEVETARADNRLGLPLGAAYLREASELMRGTLLPAAGAMYATENTSLRATSGQTTGLPLIVITIVAGVGTGFVLYRVSRWLNRVTHRVLNSGLLVAAAAAVVSLLWLAGAYAVGRADLLTAQARGSAPVEALAQADIAALQAHSDESLTLIDDTGDDSYQEAYLRQQAALGPGPGTLLTAAQTAAAGSPASGQAAAAVRYAQAWYKAHAAVRALDDSSNHAAAVGSVLGSGPGDAGTEFRLLSTGLVAGIAADQAAFDSSARAGDEAFTGLAPGVIALTLVMAVGCAWGLNRRLAEYR